MDARIKKLGTIVFSLALIFSIGFTQVGCSKKEKNDTVNLGVGFGNYTTAQFKWIELFMPKAHAAVSNLKMCFKRLRFKKDTVDSADPALDEDNVDFALGEVVIDSQGTFLGNITIPADTYVRVEFDLENDCASGNSLELANGNGSYTSTSRITIKFDGIFVASEDGSINLDIQSILSQLNTYNGTGSLKDAAEAVSGTL